MNVGIGNDALQLHFWEYINLFSAVAAGLSNRPVARSHFCGGNGPPSATRRLRGGGAVVDSKNIYVM
jgi:hypothetical protein